MRSTSASFALVAFLSVVFWMPIGMMGLEHHAGEAMEGCPFMFGEETVCTMSVFEHIASWQVLTSVVQSEASAVVFLMVATTLWFLWRLYDPPALSPPRTTWSPSRFSYTSLFRTLVLKSAMSPRAP